MNRLYDTTKRVRSRSTSRNSNFTINDVKKSTKPKKFQKINWEMRLRVNNMEQYM